MIKEIWKDIEDANGDYKISNFGRLKSFKSIKNKILGKTLKAHAVGKGYLAYTLTINGNISAKYAHRLVAKAFIENPKNKAQVNHKNGLKRDNHISNLEWMTCSENAKHAFDIGLKSANKIRGARNGRTKLKKSEVIFIKESLKGCADPIKLAKRFNVSTSCIYAIKTGKTWGYIK